MTTHKGPFSERQAKELAVLKEFRLRGRSKHFTAKDWISIGRMASEVVNLRSRSLNPEHPFTPSRREGFEGV